MLTSIVGTFLHYNADEASKYTRNLNRETKKLSSKKKKNCQNFFNSLIDPTNFILLKNKYHFTNICFDFWLVIH